MKWTVLRPSSFASNTLSWAASIQAGEPVPNTMATGVQGVVEQVLGRPPRTFITWACDHRAAFTR